MTDEEWNNITFGDRLYGSYIAKYAIVVGVIQHSLKGITGVRVKWEHVYEDRMIVRGTALDASVKYVPDSITVYERLRKEDP